MTKKKKIRKSKSNELRSDNSIATDSRESNDDGSALPSVDHVLQGTAHALTIFKPKTIAGLSIFLKRGKPYLTCYASGAEKKL